MESNSAKDRIFQRLAHSFLGWVLCSAVALAIILALYALLNYHAICRAVVHFKYDGVEYGLDPNGARFNPADFKDEDLIRQAAETLGDSLSDEDVTRIQGALIVQSNISIDALNKIIEKRSVYSDKQVAEFEDIRAGSYFPTQYTLTLDYKDAGFTREKGLLYLREILNAYEAYFYTRYGYNPSLERVILSIDYETYDYVDSVEILQNHLASLRTYLSRLSAQDNTRFVSTETGYSFSDLISAIDTLRSEDIQWVSAYITSNNITKDRNQLMDYYQYKIEDAERALVQQDSRLYTLNGLIENYVKTTAIFPLIGDAQSLQDDDETPSYEFSQPSQMYDTLINNKIACQTALSETMEQITMLQQRVERLQSEESSGSPELVEERLAAVNLKMTRILEAVSKTADEFFKTVYLKQAFQVLREPTHSVIPLGKTIRAAMPAALIVEAVLFAVYVLSAFRAARAPKREKTPRREESPAQTTASK